MNEKITYKYAAYITLLLLFSTGGYYIYQHGVDLGLEKPALVLKVSTNLTSEGIPRVNNVTFEQSSVPFFYKRTEIPPDFPEVEAWVRINKLDSQWASLTASAHSQGENVNPGVYPLKLFFRDGMEPKKGDILFVSIFLISHTGAVVEKTTSFYCWECEE